MKLGAQLYSVRNLMQTPADIRATFEKLAAMGYENVQLSGAGKIEPNELISIVCDTGMKIVCTHVAFGDIVNDTDRVINDHKIFGCSVIGLGSMPTEYRGSAAGMEKFFEDIAPAVKKIQEAGL